MKYEYICLSLGGAVRCLVTGKPIAERLDDAWCTNLRGLNDKWFPAGDIRKAWRQVRKDRLRSTVAGNAELVAMAGRIERLHAATVDESLNSAVPQCANAR